MNLQTSGSELSRIFTRVFQTAKDLFDDAFFRDFPAEACVEKKAWDAVCELRSYDSPVGFLLDHYQRQRRYCRELENSRSYRIGQMMTWLPRMLRARSASDPDRQEGVEP